MAEAAIEFNEDDEKKEQQKQSKATRSSTPASTKSPDSLKDYSLDKLNQMLDKAINNEDYEKAARIRDEINRRN
jgi:protein-arginine kinase activator protein McsA